MIDTVALRDIAEQEQQRQQTALKKKEASEKKKQRQKETRIINKEVKERLENLEGRMLTEAQNGQTFLKLIGYTIITSNDVDYYGCSGTWEEKPDYYWEIVNKLTGELDKMELSYDRNKCIQGSLDNGRYGFCVTW